MTNDLRTVVDNPDHSPGVETDDKNAIHCLHDWNDYHCQVCGLEIRYMSGRVWVHLNRPCWCTYFNGIAHEVATRATCTRASVGAVIVSGDGDHTILSTGYNGSARGEQHCIDVGCDVVDGHCQRSIHAELNAIAQAARHGVNIRDSMLYLSITLPDGSESKVSGVCRECEKVLKAAGVRWQ